MSIIRYIQEYGMCMTALTGSTRIIRKFNRGKLSGWADNQKHKVVTRFLYNHYKDTITYQNIKSIEPGSNKDNKIFVFWWQGEQTAPPL